MKALTSLEIWAWVCVLELKGAAAPKVEVNKKHNAKNLFMGSILRLQSKLDGANWDGKVPLIDILKGNGGA